MSRIFNSSSEVEAHHKSMGFTDKFCIAPFTTLLLEPDGNVGACRHKGDDFPVGNILSQSFEEIWNGDFIKSWRQEFLNGAPLKCKTEVKDRNCHHCPDYNSLIDGTQFNVHQNVKPSRIAFNFNGHCNLQCQMCYVWQRPNGLYDKINFWPQIDSWIENLKEVELLGGEPFIQKDTYKLIDLISQKKPESLWTITTNANWKLSDYVKNQLDKIKVKNIIVSLDSLETSTYEKIRLKGNLKLALDTLNDLKKYESDRISRGLSALNIRVNFLFQKNNWRELGSVHEFGKNNSFNVFRTFLYEPVEFSLLNLDEKERIEILDWYFKNLNLEQLLNGSRVIRPLIDSLSVINRAHFYSFYRELIINKKSNLQA